ncbi:MAG: GntR family transcriptional regulator [Ramlibacter sp.]|nr:GntR family transcriptional regulator [Ramlibacter sp.]
MTQAPTALAEAAHSGPAAGSDNAATPTFSPLYQQIKQAMLHSLQAGEWKPQEAIPSEMELAKRYSVSQGTVRKAIDELAAENLVIRRQGKGTFVASHNERHVEYRFLRLYPDHGTLDSEGPAQRTILECRRLRATAELAEALQLASGESVLQVRRVLSLGGVPTILEDMWLPASLFKGLTAEQLSEHQGPTYGLFERDFGVRMTRAEERVRATLPTAEQAELLQVDPAMPLLQVERTSLTYNDKPVEIRKALYRTDTHHYRNTLS